jgi:NAD(P)-dependent dehydrogenase (short-subunit alcohol dehydrogenase family)
MTRFEGQTALVVGGAHGIGRAIASRLAQEKAQVAIADIDIAEAEKVAEQIGGTALPCDVRHGHQVRRMAQQYLDRYGHLDVLMYVAGIAPAVPFLELDEDTWDRTQEVNLRGGYLTARAFAPGMAGRGYGKLVFIASTNAWDAEAQLAHYNASKAGLYLLAKTLARELGRYGINSNAIGPGFIRTRLTEPILQDPAFQKKYGPESGLIPLGRLGTPEDIAGPALFLASADAAYINGVLLFVDGGQLA